MESVSCLKQLSVEYEFGCGILVFGSFQRISEFLGMLLLFGFGLKILCSDWFSPGLIRCLCDLIGNLKTRFCSKNVVDAKDGAVIHEMEEEWKEKSNSYIDSDEIVMNSDAAEECDSDNNVYFSENLTAHFDVDDNENIEQEPHPQEETVPAFDEQDFHPYNEATDEDSESDDKATSLRRQLKIERHRTTKARVELAKERAAAATAAEEAMAMILRLQHQKSVIEMELIQYRRVAEEKQVHDQEVIQSLQWLVWRHECETTLLEDQLRLCRHKLDSSVEESEGCFKGNLCDAFENVFYSSLDAADDLDTPSKFLYRY